MKVALISSSFLPELGRLERRVDQLARGLARRGADVEILTQGPAESTVEYYERVTVRRFPTAVGPLRFAVAPKLWERLRLTSAGFDVIDVHTRHPSLALAVARSRARRLVFTPGAPMEVFLGWPYTRATRAFIAGASQIVCHTEIQRDLLCEALPRAAQRTQVIPDGVDIEAMSAARPFATPGPVVLAVDRLDRPGGVGRAIAAMPSLDADIRLVVVGDGPARDRLRAFAGDLRVSSRVRFVGAVPDAILYRWLRTARVVVALAGERGSESQVAEARAAGASVVASDLPSHRQAAERPGGGHVIFVTPNGSPLDVADAINEAAGVSVLPRARTLSLSAPSWDSVVDSTWMLYEKLFGGDPLLAAGGTAGAGLGPAPHIAVQRDARGARGVRWQPRRRPRDRMSGGRQWP
jgi:glycosyltransferase involved in cell wall biosynthesis